MKVTYQLCKKVIQNGTYKDRADMLNKLDVFLLVDRITQSEYEELVDMLTA